MPNLGRAAERVTLYARRQHEYGARGVQQVLKQTERALNASVRKLQRLPIDQAMARREPNDLKSIRALRPHGPRRMWQQLDAAAYKDRLAGAFLGCIAGCTQGTPVEGSPIKRMEALAAENGDSLPLRDYWSYVPEPKALRYQNAPREAFTRDKMRGVPVDDDTVYTLLGLLIAEDHGLDFSTADVGKAWLKYLPFACTAEEVALRNLKKGIPASRAGAIDNPFTEWIGADIRSDPRGYLAPGWPERAATMAYRDAYLSHRRQGIYGEMYFSAVIAAAFAVKDPVQALRIGLSEIPKECALAEAIRWALRLAPRIKDYRQARAAVDKKFPGMHTIHTINNACLTVFGVTIGGTDFARVIGETVAMGLDNDCTAATAGSIVGAVIGKSGLPKHWYRPFGDTVHAYIIDQPRFSIKDLERRFAKLATAAHQG
ncbi:MAG: ADP-ribosylglycohydrolase family protein [Lentisphaerae bacterium]|nr:ADP-ribosylglycohydrolase family protein [Lentisphaerota bacterium]